MAQLAKTIEEYKNWTDEDLERKIEQSLEGFGGGITFYTQERYMRLAGRQADRMEKQSSDMLEMTSAMKGMTRFVIGLTIANLVLVVLQIIIALSQ